RALLGTDLRHQFRAWCGDWNSDGISVRDQLVTLLALCRRSDRPDACHGGHVRLLSGVGLSGTLPLRRKAAQPARALVVGGGRLPRFLALGIFHYCNRCLDAEPGRLRACSRRLPPAQELLGTSAEPVGVVAVRA